MLLLDQPGRRLSHKGELLNASGCRHGIVTLLADPTTSRNPLRHVII
jgi:hypothetical protein